MIENKKKSRRSFLSAVGLATISACSNPQPSVAATTTPSSFSMETVRESLSGLVSGAAVVVTKTLVKYPMDTATVRLQMPLSPYTLRRPLELFQNAYGGVLSPLVWNVPAGSIFFAVKDATKTFLINNNKNNNNISPFWATCLAVGIAQIPYWAVRNPSEVVKTKQQAAKEGYENITSWEAFGRQWQEGNGLEGLYVGYGENIAYAYPADVIKFGVYEQITSNMLKQRPNADKNANKKKKLSPLQGAIAGAVATAIAQCITTPLDVVRNRRMANETTVTMPAQMINNDMTLSQDPLAVTTSNNATTGSIPSPTTSYIQELVTLAQNEGWKGLFAGVSPRIGKAILSGAIQFATYEETKQKMNALLSGGGGK